MSSHRHTYGAHHNHDAHHNHGTHGLAGTHGRAGHGRPRRRPRPEWIALLTLAALAASCAAAWALADGPAKAGPDTARPSALTRAIAQANQLGQAAGKLPRDSCARRGANQVACTSPAPGVAWAVFEVYPSLTALYHAYEARVREMRHHPFIQNVGNCGLPAPRPGGDETAWNHRFRHPRRFTVAAMSAGRVPEAAAAGRVFCVSPDSAQEEMAWTQDDGRLLAVVAGPDHEAVWQWWSAVHHNIVLGGRPMPMAPAG